METYEALVRQGVRQLSGFTRLWQSHAAEATALWAGWGLRAAASGRRWFEAWGEALETAPCLPCRLCGPGESGRRPAPADAEATKIVRGGRPREARPRAPLCGRG